VLYCFYSKATQQYSSLLKKAIYMRNLLTFNANSTFTLDIAVNEKCVIAGAHVQINAISMFFDKEHEGDVLTVNWTLTGNTALDKRIMRKLYTNDAFKMRIVQLLTANGISAASAASVRTSVAAMQEKGRASFDAINVGDEVVAYVTTMQKAS